jgi:hypothetical protein
MMKKILLTIETFYSIVYFLIAIAFLPIAWFTYLYYKREEPHFEQDGYDI